MTAGLPEKHVVAMFHFGHRTTVAAGASTYLPGTGGTNQAAEISLLVPASGMLRNLSWDCQTNGLTGGSFIVRVGALHPTPTAPAPALVDALTVSLAGGLTSGSAPFDYAVLAGQRIAVFVQAVGGTNISRLRVSFALEVDQASQTFQLAADSSAFYDAGNVGIGTATPQKRLTLGPGSDLAVEMSTPVLTSVVPLAGGDLSPGTYHFAVAAEDGAGGTTVASNVMSFPVIALSPVKSCQLTWTPVQGGRNYVVYVGTGSPITWEHRFRPAIGVTTMTFFIVAAPEPALTLPPATTAFVNRIAAQGTSYLFGGRVGIGTMAPQALLEVNGDVRADSVRATVVNGDQLIANMGLTVQGTTMLGALLAGDTAISGVLDVNSNLIRGAGKYPGAGTVRLLDGDNVIWFEWSGNTLRIMVDSSCVGTVVPGVKSFVIEHPHDPSRYLVHATVEGPENVVFYRGQARLERGRARVRLPGYFEALTREDGRTVQLTNLDGLDRLAVRSNEGRIVRDGILEVFSDDPASCQAFLWEVKAIRKDVAPLRVEVPKDEVVLAGQGPYTYLRPRSPAPAPSTA